MLGQQGQGAQQFAQYAQQPSPQTFGQQPYPGQQQAAPFAQSFASPYELRSATGMHSMNFTIFCRVFQIAIIKNFSQI